MSLVKFDSQSGFEVNNNSSIISNATVFFDSLKNANTVNTVEISRTENVSSGVEEL